MTRYPNERGGALILFLLFLSYSLSGYVMWAMGKRIKSVLPED